MCIMCILISRTFQQKAKFHGHVFHMNRVYYSTVPCRDESSMNVNSWNNKFIVFVAVMVN